MASCIATGVAQCQDVTPHPLGSKAKVLLSSVFGPYAQDDEYGSRAINPMELYHNQVTRTQGAFSLRMFHRSWGLMVLQANMSASCRVLDFPTLERFVEEIRERRYDIIGITGIIPNVHKVEAMCELIRRHQPDATIVIGGHVANLPDLDRRVKADHIVRGEGVRWFRRFLGEDEDQPIHHPVIWSGVGARAMGVNLPFNGLYTAATLLPSVGCPIGCDFCATSAMFGGKGRFINFYETGDELFDVMCQLEKAMGVKSFFVMDENFLLHRRRALRLLELMEAHDKPWALYVFSSANALQSYTMEQLVALGISWVWMGLEGKDSQYHKHKLANTDSHRLVKQLQSHGIRVLGSSIIGMDEHTPENIDDAIDYAVSHATEFHQFMLYTPTPGTPLHERLGRQGALLSTDEIDEADVHGQYRFGHRHPNIPAGQETEMVLRAFRKDFEVNGPSILRIVATTLAGWKRYRNHPNPRIAARFAWEVANMAVGSLSSVWAGRKLFRDNPRVVEKLDALLRDGYAQFGWKARLLAPVVGCFLLASAKRETKRLARGWTYEPPTFYDTNVEADARAAGPGPRPDLCQFITPTARHTATAASQEPEPALVS